MTEQLTFKEKLKIVFSSIWKFLLIVSLLLAGFFVIAYYADQHMKNHFSDVVKQLNELSTSDQARKERPGEK